MNEAAERYVVIMAGGSGTRFWPKSRRALPKQILTIFTGRTMVEEALERALALAPAERVLVVTTREQAEPTRIAIGGRIPARNVLEEPMGRDTAPCIALACAAIVERSDEAVMLVMPADHVIRPTKAFARAAEAGFAAARDGALVTFGVLPTHPATGYGYIAAGEVVREDGGARVRAVKAFKEKPDAATAQRFLAEGDHYWNSGIFVWRLSAILAEFERQVPRLREAVEALGEALRSPEAAKELRRIYETLPKKSIDYAVMENAREVLMVETEYQWSDVGSWTSLRELLARDAKGNAVVGKHAGIATSDCVVFADEGQLVATIGVEDLVIVATKDATLVMKATEAQRTKELVEMLAKLGEEGAL
ncbi:MAG: sugar phosphate nucleotidyltransferase [Planctomycetota bacterium]